jgi:pimeloyl-ACP methyl ester carboxylesterase
VASTIDAASLVWVAEKECMFRKIARLVLIVAVVYACVCVALFFAQRHFLYFPPPGNSSASLPKIELNIDAGKVIVNTRELPGENALIYFGGNGEDVAYSLPMLSSAFPARSLYLMNYRGYGGSAGKPTEASIIADARSLFDMVHLNHKNVMVVGRSLGTGVAIHLASERPVERLILVTPYFSMEELAEAQFSIFPVSWILQDKYESWKYAATITTPTLLIQAERDEVIPAESTMKLLRSFHGGVATIRQIRGAGHNSISQYPEYAQLLQTKW